MSTTKAWKTNTVVFALLAAALAIAEPHVETAKAVNKEELRRAEIEKRKANPVQLARPTDPQARELFLEIERIARLPRTEQIRQLSHLYHDLAPRYMSPLITMIISSYRSNILENDNFDSPGADHLSTWARQLSDAAKELTREQVADRIASGMWLNVAARVRCIQIFKERPEQIMKLIDSDLDSGEAARVERAASTILAVELRSYSKRLLEMFLAEATRLKTSESSNRSVSDALRRTLLFLHDPAVIPVLLKKVKQDPGLLVHVSGFFQGPLYHKPADPMLLALVSSKDREVSYHAAHALAECRDARLAPLAAEFAQDRESRFRWLAGHWSLNLPRRSFLSIRTDLLPLLKDKEADVFEQALRCCTRHKDPEAGKVILAMLKQTEISSQLEVAVMQCFQELAGSHFGYYMHDWGPGHDKNSKAIETFESWLKEEAKHL